MVRAAITPGIAQPVPITKEDGFTGQTNLFEDGVQNHGYTRHVAAVLQERHQEIHYHYQRQEADNGTNTADDTICYQCLHEGRCAGKLICNKALEGLNPACQNICQIGPQLRLGDIEYQEHNHNENQNTAMGFVRMASSLS